MYYCYSSTSGRSTLPVAASLLAWLNRLRLAGFTLLLHNRMGRDCDLGSGAYEWEWVSSLSHTSTQSTQLFLERWHEAR